MFFFRINTSIENTELITETKDRSANRAFCSMLSEKSETMLRQQKQENYIFVVTKKANNLTLGAILKKGEDVKSVISEFENITKLSFVMTETEEITFKAMYSLLFAAYRAEYVSDYDEILRLFDLQPLGNHCSINYSEALIDKQSTKDSLLTEASRLLSHESLEPEIERIYSGKAIRKVMGHPVHYLVCCDDYDTNKSIYQILLNALYSNKRIESRRYAFTDWNIDDGWPNDSYEAMYKSCEGGAVVIRYISSSNDNNGRYARSNGNAIVGICEKAFKYRNSVLTILCIPTDCQKVRDAFLENFESLSMIEIKEDKVFGEKAKIFLQGLAKAAHIRTDKKLFQNIENKDQAYTATELKKIFYCWYDNKLRTSVFPQYKQALTVKAEIVKTQPKGSAIEELNKMIGLSEAKAVINKALNFYKIQKLYRANGVSTEHPTMHMVFSGNPGTAKTTVARLFAQIMKDNGMLSKGDLYEVGRADLVGKYVGWTAQIVKDKFRAARGSVLFIDEAYSLIDDKDGLYGDEAINTIVQEMENNREDMVVIFAGYPDKMKEFMLKNPGLRSRIAFHVSFQDYSVSELCDIAKLIAYAKGMHISQDAFPKLMNIFNTVNKNSNFGNGRFVRNLIENAKMEQANRILALDMSKVTSEDICCLDEKDFVIPEMMHGNENKKIGFCCEMSLSNY